jgi:hypothetical protein
MLIDFDITGFKELKAKNRETIRQILNTKVNSGPTEFNQIRGLAFYFLVYSHTNQPYEIFSYTHFSAHHFFL